MRAVATLPSLASVRRTVHETLCAHDNLDIEQTPLFQAIITRQGKPCGAFFHIKGPRLLKTYAVWAEFEKRILFYDSKGERFAEARLDERPVSLKLAA